MIKNENDYDVDALMAFTIITRPFFILIYTCIYLFFLFFVFLIFRGKCSGTK